MTFRPRFTGYRFAALLPVRASRNCQNTPAEASLERPKTSFKYLIEQEFSSPRAKSVAIFPRVSPVRQGISTQFWRPPNRGSARRFRSVD